MAKQLHTIQMRVSEFSLHLIKNLLGLIPFSWVGCPFEEGFTLHSRVLETRVRWGMRRMNLKLFQGHCDSGLLMIVDKGPRENSDKGAAEG